MDELNEEDFLRDSLKFNKCDDDDIEEYFKNRFQNLVNMGLNAYLVDNERADLLIQYKKHHDFIMND